VRAGYRLELAAGAPSVHEPVVALDATALVFFASGASVRIGDATRSLDGPAVALVNPGTSYCVASAGEGERLVVALHPETLAEAAGRLGLGSDGLVLFRRDAALLSTPVELSARRVAHELRSVERDAVAVLDAATALLATDLVREHGHVNRESRLERSRAGVVDRRLRRSVELMHDHFARDLQLGEIAAAAHLSEYHFARLFKRITGVTPHTYLATVRVEQARRLLAATDLSVAEVAERVGYQSASHFGKVFRQVAGTTPTAFREDVLRGSDVSG
jgi:AraC family transcriptional regulator